MQSSNSQSPCGIMSVLDLEKAMAEVVAGEKKSLLKKISFKNNDFYCFHYHHAFFALMGLIVLLMIAILVLIYQLRHRPLPVFYAIQPNKHKMVLTSFKQPNLLPDTILRFASKAATAAYTFDFNNYTQQLNAAKSYFTAAGWQDYLNSVNTLISTIVQNQLFVNGVVSGTPVIANQGPLPGKGYVWRVQIPFLVTYQSSNTQSRRRFFVTVTIMRVPTSTNVQGIGIDQFVMI